MLASPRFVAQHRTRENAFTRESKLSFAKLILFLLNQVRACLQTELDHFFQVLTDAHVAVRQVTKGAMCRARQKLSYHAFVALNRQAVSAFYQWAPVKQSILSMLGGKSLAAMAEDLSSGRVSIAQRIAMS